jgi:predicted porin
MKKSLIAVAVAGLFAAPVAMADVTISGAIATGVIYGKSSGGGAGDLTKTQLGSNYSHVDIESVDDIGNGNKVVFHLQMQVNIQDPTPGANPFNRNSFLGIVGNWGAVKYGTNENVYERLQYSSDFMDGALGPGGNLMILGTPGAATVFEVGESGCAPQATLTPGVFTGGCVGFYRRTEHTIWYESPNFNGFSFEVDYTLSANKTATTNPRVVSIGGKYAPEGMPFFVDAAYEKHDDLFGITKITGEGGTGSSDTGFQIGGGYTFGDFQINARWERLTYEQDGNAAGVSEYERDAIWLGVKMNLPTGYAAVQFGQAGDADIVDGGVGQKANDTGATHFSVGYFHNLSKQSQLQAIYNQTSNDANANYLAVGGTNAVNGADHKGLYLGIKHTF